MGHPIEKFAVTVLMWLVAGQGATGQITRPADAPEPLSPEESVKRVSLPAGFRLELLAAEPLVKQPSGVCWDESGRMFVSELHGYNLEGQYDIEALNQTGKLDRVVRRISAPPEAVARAERDQHGVVKHLIDDDGDGRMDRVEVWADDLPPCIGICPARDGVIVAAAPDIVFLADRDRDGKAEVREVLFTGFALGPLERRINHPRWGLDDWIYFGRGRACRVTGARLPGPVDLPATDFRIKADGSAIEPITGGTQSIGYAFTESGERFVATTGSPGLHVAPLPWRYLARNPDLAPGTLQRQASSYRNCFPTGKPHPWRTKRAEDPGFFQYYRKRYGASESDAAGWFTSGCSPLVYRDAAIPMLTGHYLVCEPAGNIVHRAIIERDGIDLRLVRAESEKESEFLSSSDIWFHPIALGHAPDGSVAVVDYYREIIEDYSAIPRYLQQQYRLDHGKDHGRIWRLVHEEMPAAPDPDLAKLGRVDLAKEVGSPYFWRRETARRLLWKRGLKDGEEVLTTMARFVEDVRNSSAAAINAMHTLRGIDALPVSVLLAGLRHPDPGVRVQALRLSESGALGRSRVVGDQIASMVSDRDPSARLQLALTLGEDRSNRVLEPLGKLLGSESRWMGFAVRSSVYNRELDFLEVLLTEGADAVLLGEVCGWIAVRRRGAELARVFEILVRVDSREEVRVCLKALRSHLGAKSDVALSETGHAALEALVRGGDGEARRMAEELQKLLTPESAERRKERLAGARRVLSEMEVPAQVKIAAVRELAIEDDPSVTPWLLEGFRSATPAVRVVILDALFSRRQRLLEVLAALESNSIPPSSLSALQRDRLLKHGDEEFRGRAEKLFSDQPDGFAEIFERYRVALERPRDRRRGEELFRKHCALCHRVRGAGNLVGPDLSGEMNRAEETLIKDILSPGSEISAGYATYVIETKGGNVYTGLLAGEAPGNLTLKDTSGATYQISRTDIASLKTVDVSLMPESLSELLAPRDVADIIGWLREGDGRPDGGGE